jgi:hypothetical protein
VSYFNLRKRDTEAEVEPGGAEAEEPAETPEETAEEPEGEPEGEQPAKQHGPLLTGILGPGRWIAARLGSSWALGVHVVAVWAIGFYGGWIAAGVILGWLAAVLVFVPREFKDRVSGWIERWISGRSEPDEQPEEERPASAPEEVYAATLQWVRGQVGDSNGIHLSDLLAHAHAHNLHTDLDVTAFRAVLERWGFPIRQQLKVGGKNRPGIHRDDLPKQPLPTPSPEETGSATTTAVYPI